jgi:acyl-coenzyme A thioesterase PaaI-like protein
MSESFLAVQDFYAEEFAWCYGCGRLNGAGHHFRTRWDGEETLTVFEPGPEYTAIPGFVYGGLLAALIDCHSTGSGALALHRQDGHVLGDGAATPRCVTGSLKVDYLKPTPLGVPLVARGTIAEVGARKVRVVSELTAGGLVTARGDVIAVRVPENFGQSN